MGTIRKFAEQLHLSTFTISAALRGLPGVGAGTSERVLRHAARQGHALPKSWTDGDSDDATLPSLSRTRLIPAEERVNRVKSSP